MPLSFHRRSAVVDRLIPYAEFNRLENGLIAYWDTQKQSGAVLPCFNPALALGRELLFKDFTAGLWATSGTAVLDDLDSFTTTGTGGMRANDSSIAAGKTYTARIKGTTTSANLKFTSFDSSQVFKDLGTGAFDETFTFTATAQGLRFQNTGAGTTDIDWPNCTIKQTDIAASSVFPGSELLTNTGRPFLFTADSLADWLSTGEVGNDPEISEVGSGQSHGGAGTGSLNLFNSVTANEPRVRQTSLTKGVRIIAETIISAITGSVRVGDQSASYDLYTTVGTKSTETTVVDTTAQIRVVAAGTNVTIDSISYRPAAPMNGDITGLSLGIQSGTPLEYLVSSDGVNDNLSIDSAELNSFINWDNLSFDMWAIADTWAAGTDYLFNFGIDSNNYFRGYRTGANLIIEHKAGGTQKSVTKASGSPSGLFHFGGSIDTDGSGTITLIYNGLPGGTATSLGTMVGNLSSDETVIGAFNDSGSNSWAGDWTHPTLFNITKTAGDWIRRFEAGGV